MSSNKRVRNSDDPNRQHHRPTETNRNVQPQIPSSAYITAYEAQLVYGRDDLAQKASRKDQGDQGGSSGSQRTRGSLIKWAGDHEGDKEIWADRYDILHLLPSLPAKHARSPSPTRSSSSSWDDIPSDLEDTFFLSGDEDIEVYEREKKQRWMEALREDRLRERNREENEREMKDGKLGKGRGNAWGGDDESPPEATLTLMSHTAQSFASSPNPRLLEMRIITHHANDERFAFLRGRYKHTWLRVKGDVMKGKARPKEEKAMGALVGGYESSDEEEEEERILPSPPPLPPSDEDVPLEPVIAHLEDNAPTEGIIEKEAGELGEDEEEKKRLRRERAEEWKRQRAKAKESGPDR